MSRFEELPVFHAANAHFVTPRLAVGGDLAANFVRARVQLDDLAANGITHIVDTRIEASDEALVAGYAPELRYLHHDVADAGQTIPAEWFESLNAWVSDALTDPDSKILVHCHMGINRAPSAMFAVLLGQGWGVADALSRIRTQRAIAVIDYADDALTWHHDRTDASPEQRRKDRKALSDWRRRHSLDAFEVIRRTRADEPVTNGWLIRCSDADAGMLLEAYASDPRVVFGHVLHRHIDELSRNDLVFLWRTEPADRAGVFGVGEVLVPPSPLTDAEGTPEPGSAPGAGGSPAGEAVVLPVFAVRVADGLIPADSLERYPALADSTMFTDQPNPTRLSLLELTALIDLLRRPHQG